jgi:hypothetical protein
MKKYQVHINETNFYLSKEIEAQDETEAEEKYMKMFNNGDVEVNKNELSEISITEI